MKRLPIRTALGIALLLVGFPAAGSAQEIRAVVPVAMVPAQLLDGDSHETSWNESDPPWEGMLIGAGVGALAAVAGNAFGSAYGSPTSSSKRMAFYVLIGVGAMIGATVDAIF